MGTDKAPFPKVALIWPAQPTTVMRRQGPAALAMLVLMAASRSAAAARKLPRSAGDECRPAAPALVLTLRTALICWRRCSPSAPSQLARSLRAAAAPLSGELAGFAEHGPQLIEPVNAFFDDVLVMADDPDLRAARLGLLAAVLNLAPSTIDWQALDNALGERR